MKSYLLGMVHAARGRRSREDFADSGIKANNRFNSLPFDEAMEWAANRISLSPSDYAKLSDHMKLHAFTVGRLAQLDQIETARKAYLKSLKTGPDTDSFISFMSKDDQDARFAKYYEIVYRTNIQTDYNAGRAKQLSADPPVALQFIGIEDGRQSEVCKACSGIILPYTDPFWDTHWPPLHYKCRSTVRAIYEYEAEAMGLMTKDGFRQQKKESLGQHAEAGNPKPQGTFGANPIKDNQMWKVTPSQQSRLIKDLIMEEINGVAGQTVCKDFQREISGYINEKVSSGGVRYPEKMPKKEMKYIESAKDLAEQKGFFVELNGDVTGKPGNTNFDAWINGVMKCEFKHLDTEDKDRISKHIRKAASQAGNILIRLSSPSQIEPFMESFLEMVINGGLSREGRELGFLAIDVNGRIIMTDRSGKTDEGQELTGEMLTEMFR
ncbi:MAG: minor capsid protein [Sphaerochaetaceae bacterium]